MFKIMSIEKIKNKLFNHSIKDDKWLREAKWREENKDWLEISATIAIKILRWLRENKLSQKELAKKLKFSSQYLNKILKGSQNLTIETICKIENILQIKLIELTSFEVVIEYKSKIIFPSSKGNSLKRNSIKIDQSYQHQEELYSFESDNLAA